MVSVYSSLSYPSALDSVSPSTSADFFDFLDPFVDSRRSCDDVLTFIPSEALRIPVPNSFFSVRLGSLLRVIIVSSSSIFRLETPLVPFAYVPTRRLADIAIAIKKTVLRIAIVFLLLKIFGCVGFLFSRACGAFQLNKICGKPNL